MAQTTTGITACDIGVWGDLANGTLTDISGSNKVSMNFDREIGMFRTFQSQWPRRLECGKDAKFTLVVVYSEAADEGSDLIKDWYHAAAPGDRTFKFYVPDKNVGSDVYSGEFKLLSYSFELVAGSAEAVMVTAELVPNGAITVVTNAT